ncbi:hypothetical protein O181_097710 [Austropuccinia psidii MF-1]|uniref:Uncharacterized protein n=1 Tax=Austropuccinia psidii MF-1 TaxID=1389203 RepID=A0A9Q3JA44_9BASI|nr:hypothetical protein [Austropuccinia psidii MF-1]
MGISLVAQVKGIGIDPFQLISDRLIRDHQALPPERWVSLIKSYRLPISPVYESQTDNDKYLGLDNDLNEIDKTKSRKQRAMYCLRHSARPAQIVAMIEDPNAPSRSTMLDPKSSRILTQINSQCDLDDLINTLPSKQDHQVISTFDQIHDLKQIETINQDALKIIATPTSKTNTENVWDESSGSIKIEKVDPISSLKTLTSSPNHYRTSIISVPESFEFLLNTVLCAPPTNQTPSTWTTRPNLIAIEGLVWAVYSNSFDMHVNSSLDMTLGSNHVHKDNRPDWWIRLGSVSNKGATGSNTCLPWLVLEIECLASPLDLTSTHKFLENILAALIRPNDKLTMKPLRLDEQDLFDAGLINSTEKLPIDDSQESDVRRNGYSLLMLAKREGLI